VGFRRHGPVSCKAPVGGVSADRAYVGMVACKRFQTESQRVKRAPPSRSQIRRRKESEKQQSPAKSRPRRRERVRETSSNDGGQRRPGRSIAKPVWWKPVRRLLKCDWTRPNNEVERNAQRGWNSLALVERREDGGDLREGRRGTRTETSRRESGDFARPPNPPTKQRRPVGTGHAWQRGHQRKRNHRPAAAESRLLARRLPSEWGEREKLSRQRPGARGGGGRGGNAVTGPTGEGLGPGPAHSAGHRGARREAAWSGGHAGARGDKRRCSTRRETRDCQNPLASVRRCRGASAAEAASYNRIAPTEASRTEPGRRLANVARRAAAPTTGARRGAREGSSGSGVRRAEVASARAERCQTPRGAGKTGQALSTTSTARNTSTESRRNCHHAAKAMPAAPQCV